MSFQPDLKHTLHSINQINFLCKYENSYIELDNPAIDESHIHTCYEVYVNLSGNISFLHKETIHKIQPGDIVFSKPGEIHHCIYHSPCVHEHFCIWFDIAPTSPIKDYIDRNQFDGLIRLKNDLHHKLFSLLHKFHNAKDSDKEFEKLSNFFELLNLFSEKEAFTAETSSNIPCKMQEILNYINASFTNIYSVEEIADHFHISIPTLNRWFREFVHLSPYQYLTANKLSYSEKLLRAGTSVTDACFMAGFTNCSRFISLFKEHYGKTPLQYQKSLKESYHAISLF